MKLPPLMAALAVAVVSLPACQTNQSGRVAAGKIGDLSQPAQRGSPIEVLRAACGDGAVTPAGAQVILREPYLQQVSATSAMLGWVASAVGGTRVEITRPGGESLATATGDPQAGSLRRAGEQQTWAQVEDLAPETIYCYSLWAGTERLTAPTGFRTAPAAESARPVRFMVFGDSGGGGSDQYALRDQMYTVPYELMLHTGDLAYDNGSITQFDDNVFGVYADILRNISLSPAAGNHDYDTLRGAPFREVFALPGDSGEKWYSFDWGRAHFAALDTESDYATQAAWLDRDLAASAAPWKIVYLHRPPYSSGTHGSDTALRAALGSVVERHGVQLVLAGHDHDYERIRLQRGVTYIVTGGGGVGTRSVGTSSFTEFSEDVIHFVYAEITGDQLVVHAIDATGAEFDSVAIAR